MKLVIGLLVFTFFDEISSRRVQGDKIALSRLGSVETEAEVTEHGAEWQDDSADDYLSSEASPSTVDDNSSSEVSPPTADDNSSSEVSPSTADDNLSSEISTRTAIAGSDADEPAESEVLKPTQSNEQHRLLAVLPSGAANWTRSIDATVDLDEAGERDPFSKLTMEVERYVGFVGIHVLVPALLFFVFILTICIRHSMRRNSRQQFKHRGRLIYEWDQSETKMFMYIQLPDSIDSEDDLDIRISPRHVRIARMGKFPFIKGQLLHAIDDEESSWKINKDRELELCFAKSEPCEWSSVLLPQDSI